MDYPELVALGIALGLGLLVGFQREQAHSRLGGIRTFPIITVLGTLLALLADRIGQPWLIAAGGLSLAILIAATTLARSRQGETDFGQTTEVAALLMYVVGAYLAFGDYIPAIAVGGVVVVLLHLKSVLGGFAERMKEKDTQAIMQLVAISLIILPILPDQEFGPYGVLNPHSIWMMVVLIVGISIAGYFIYKGVGEGIGSIAAGILGGLISSTATTVTYARRVRETGEASRLSAFVITTASMIAFVRVIIEVAAVVPQAITIVAPPLAIMTFCMALISAALYWFKSKDEENRKEEMPEPENPAQLKSALIFASLYAVILVAVAFSREYFGESGLYVVSALSGLTDVDAITLSLSNMTRSGSLEAGEAWKLILVAALSNLLFKGGMVFLLGHRRLAGYIALAFGISLAAGLLILWLW